jgi:hypothetical protein
LFNTFTISSFYTHRFARLDERKNGSDYYSYTAMTCPGKGQSPAFPLM